MSIEAMTIALHHSRASGVARLVLIGIANHDGDAGSWPTVQTLAKYANVSVRTVQRAIGDLEELGEIIVHKNAGGTHRHRDDRRPNLYEVVLACPATCDGTKNHRSANTIGSERRDSNENVRGDNCVTPSNHDHSDRPVDNFPRGDTPVTAMNKGNPLRGDKSGSYGVTTVSPKPSFEAHWV